MDKVVIVGWIAVAHFAANVVVMYLLLRFVGFDLDHWPPGPLERVLTITHDVLGFPLVTAAESESFHRFSPAVAYPANSLLWGLFVFAIAAVVHRIVTSKRKVYPSGLR